jgi:hypothetical protein
VHDEAHFLLYFEAELMVSTESFYAELVCFVAISITAPTTRRQKEIAFTTLKGLGRHPVWGCNSLLVKPIRFTYLKRGLSMGLRASRSALLL